MAHAARALQSHDLSWERIKLCCGSHILFWPHKDMEGLSGWVISPMPGRPPRQNKYERQYTPSIHSVIPTRRMWMMITANDTRGPWGPKVSWHLSYRWGKTPKKTSPRKLVPTGHRTRALCVTSAHATTYSTAVDLLFVFIGIASVLGNCPWIGFQ